MRPRRFREGNSLMQIASAVVGSAAAAQVIVPADQDAERDRSCCEFHDPVAEAVQCCDNCPDADPCGTCQGRGCPECSLDEGPDPTGQAEQHTYLTGATPGVYEMPHRMDVVGANGRRLIAFRSPEGVWIGGCLVPPGEDLERLCVWLRGGNEGES